MGDVSHALSKCILMFSIHRYRSAEGTLSSPLYIRESKKIKGKALRFNQRANSTLGVSLITQAFYAIVFCTRYLDLFTVYPWNAIKINAWNFFFKIFYIASSFYILLLMTRVFARTREREAAWKMGAYSLGGSVLLAPILTLIFRETGRRGPLNASISSIPPGNI
jgi:ER lumen protein retaining receptor